MPLLHSSLTVQFGTQIVDWSIWKTARMTGYIILLRQISNFLKSTHIRKRLLDSFFNVNSRYFKTLSFLGNLSFISVLLWYFKHSLLTLLEITVLGLLSKKFCSNLRSVCQRTEKNSRVQYSSTFQLVRSIYHRFGWILEDAFSYKL